MAAQSLQSKMTVFPSLSKVTASFVNTTLFPPKDSRQKCWSRVGGGGDRQDKIGIEKPTKISKKNIQAELLGELHF